VKIVWDEPKRQPNLAEHGMDFADLDSGFFDEAIIGKAKDGPSSRRLVADITTVIFVDLGTEAVSVISMRPASMKERKRYDQGV
jgi:uncharacterized DUF497 family protein